MSYWIGSAAALAITAVVFAGPADAQTAPLSGVPSGLPEVHTLQEALSLAYTYNPTLTAARAGVRATDENVPAALAGWRPQIVASGSAGKATGHINSVTDPLTGNIITSGASLARTVATAQIQGTEYIYRGGRTKAQTNQALNRVYAARAQLLATEEQVLGQAVSAYVGVISAEQTLELDRTDELVLTRQLQATNDRFNVGEITRTDVAQAEASLAAATATRQTAEGSLQTARATFVQIIGVMPGRLKDPQPLRLPTKTEEEAQLLAARNNPNVVAALFNDAQAKDTFDLAYSQIMPTLSLQGSAFYNRDVQQQFLREQGAQITANLTVPIYQGGAEYAAIRQARQQELQARRQTDDARRTAVQAAINAWETYASSKASITSDKAAITANEIALEGIEREALVGSRTTLDVLNAQEALLQSRLTLVQTLTNYVNASYTLAQAVGRLTARDLRLPVALYDDTAYYNAVKDLWIGTGDFATDQPGR